MIVFLRVSLKERAIGSLYLSLVPDFQTFFCFRKAFNFLFTRDTIKKDSINNNKNNNNNIDKDSIVNGHNN